MQKMSLTEDQKKELKFFVERWKNKIPDKYVYFSFNGGGHIRFINANDEGLVRFGIKNIEAALSNEKYTSLGGEYPGEEWIKEEDEDLSIHYIEKVNDNIEKHIANRHRNEKSAKIGGKVIASLIMIGLIGLIGFTIYLFIFWLNN
jgi:hypothetical protein